MPEVYDISDPVPDKKPVDPQSAQKKDAAKPPGKGTGTPQPYKSKMKGLPPPDPRRQKRITAGLVTVIVVSVAFIFWWTVLRNSGPASNVTGDKPGVPVAVQPAGRPLAQQDSGLNRSTLPPPPRTNRPT